MHLNPRPAVAERENTTLIQASNQFPLSRGFSNVNTCGLGTDGGKMGLCHTDKPCKTFDRLNVPNRLVLLRQCCLGKDGAVVQPRC